MHKNRQHIPFYILAFIILLTACELYPKSEEHDEEPVVTDRCAYPPGGNYIKMQLNGEVVDCIADAMMLQYGEDYYLQISYVKFYGSRGFHDTFILGLDFKGEGKYSIYRDIIYDKNGVSRQLSGSLFFEVDYDVLVGRYYPHEAGEGDDINELIITEYNPHAGNHGRIKGTFETTLYYEGGTDHLRKQPDTLHITHGEFNILLSRITKVEIDD